MDTLLELMRLYGCDYMCQSNMTKSTFNEKNADSMKDFFANSKTIVDCGMATTGLATLYCLSQIEQEHLETITTLLCDPKNKKDEHLYTIPRDGVVDKNMLMRILPKDRQDDYVFKIEYFRTNFLQDKLLDLNLGFQTTSWGMWCIDVGYLTDDIPDDFLYRKRETYDRKKSLYAFFNGKDDNFKYRWVIGSTEDIEEVTEKDCIRDLELSIKDKPDSRIIVDQIKVNKKHGKY